MLRFAPLPNAIGNDTYIPSYPPTVLHSEIISENDPRARMFDAAKKKELVGLFKRGAFRIVLREEAGENPNILPSRFVLTIKHPDSTGPPQLKARFVIGGHRDRDRHKQIHDTRTVRPESIRVLVAIATIFGMRLSIFDWLQSYTQSGSNLLRDVFISPSELHLTPQQLVQILLPVYGLTESGEYWGDTLSNHLREHCSFKQSTTDLAFWLKSIGSKVVAVATSYVDDVLLAATPSALKQFAAISKNRFDVKIDTSDSLGYLGMQIVTHQDGSRSISQPK